ncbi:MAG TPA: hypothetical protein VHF69_06230 [Candidatus Synoicihabitans sp.]|nr:hypothetical protein [Candidatus Synoicihabitans sp.]
MTGCRAAAGAEWKVYQAAGGRCFVLAIDKPTKIAQLRALMLAWDEIAAVVADQDPPYMYTLTRQRRLRPYVGPSAAKR